MNDATRAVPQAEEMGTVRLVCGVDRLDAGQSLRLQRAVAVLKAKKAAIVAGLPLDHLDDYVWKVDVEPVDPGLVEGALPVSHG